MFSGNVTQGIARASISQPVIGSKIAIDTVALSWVRHVRIKLLVNADLFLPHIQSDADDKSDEYLMMKSPTLFPKKVLTGCNFMAIKSVPRKVFGSSRAPVKFSGKK